MCQRRVSAWRRWWAVVDTPRRTVWETLHEPRAETWAMVVAYGIATVTGVASLLSTLHAGPLPTGTWSTRIVASVLLVVAGALGVPTAWRGVWRLERIATLWVGIAAVLRIVAIVTFSDSLAEATAIYGTGTWLMILAGMRMRWVRIAPSDYRLGAGPIPTVMEAELEAEEATRHLREKEHGGARCG